MSDKHQLRSQRLNTTINTTSKKEDKQCLAVVNQVIENLSNEFGLNLCWQKRTFLNEIIDNVKLKYSKVSFATTLKTSYMSPDGGITYLIDKRGNKYPILIAEVKNQGTNDLRVKEGLKKQSLGNAVERLGKNVIGFKTLMLGEKIFPFICFGDGCDFADGSSILDRVCTIAMFGELNTDNTFNAGPNGEFARGSYYFREPKWTTKEMYERMYNVAKQSILYYLKKYGKRNF